VPKGGVTRAATDRIRETLFGILTPYLAGADVLDLFAGAGSLGIEALSRGAAHATFVEQSAAAVAAIRTNLETTGLGGRATVVRADALAYLAGPVRADIAFCDPPFADVALHGAVLAALAGPGRLVVARALRKHLPAIPPSLALARTREIGEETLLLLQYSGQASAGG
ncbi:MAG: RsmD family RNA methyltransferase, partial [Chloroflexota bacterium]|nr:RsmD family RNA methyltransferase [Chloroflexota bacterium]